MNTVFSKDEVFMSIISNFEKRQRVLGTVIRQYKLFTDFDIRELAYRVFLFQKRNITLNNKTNTA